MGLEGDLDGLGIFAADRHPLQYILVGVKAHHIPVEQPHCGPLNRADWRYRRCLARLLHLDLGSRCHELSQ